MQRSIADTRLLMGAAREAGVRRLVHVSVVNASPEAPTEYFRAKARLENDVRASGLSWVIVRPTLTYGPGDILVNNLSWVLRRFPVFAIPGDGRYRLQPVHVDDVAAIAVGAAPGDETRVLDAAGPETFAFDDFVGLLADAVGSRALRIHVPPRLSRLGSQVIGLLVRDVVLTADEVTELMASLLVSGEPPAGRFDSANGCARQPGSWAAPTTPSWIATTGSRPAADRLARLARGRGPPRRLGGFVAVRR